MLLVCAMQAATAEESHYNKGVEAWRTKNFAEARRQWEQSLASGGPDEALNNLGFLLYNGLGGEPNHAKAVELWRKGAALSVSEAQLHLGHAYEDGKGVGRNLVSAYAWYRCAIATAEKLSKADKTEAEIGKNALTALRQLTSKLSAQQVADGDKQAAQLIAKYADRLVTKP